MKAPELLIFDIDGTCNKRVYQVIQKFIESGHFVTFATGRGYLRTIQALTGFKPNAPLILEDGGRITNINGLNIYLSQLSEDEILSVKSVIKKNHDQIDLAVFYPLHDQKMQILSLGGKGDLTVSNLRSIKGQLTRDVDSFIEWAHSLGSVMITVISKEGSQLNIPNEISWTIAAGEYNFHPQGINKASGVKCIVSLLGISYDQTAVIGNDNNDLSMFELPVGMKIAVGDNAELQSLATHCIKSPDELADFLKKLKVQT